MNTLDKAAVAIFLNFALMCNQVLAQLPPGWWMERGATNANPPNDHAVVTQGQLKHFTRKAVDELNARIPGGAGADLTTLVGGWGKEYQDGNHSIGNPLPADFHAMTAGQLKWVAEKFHDRLQYAKYLNAPPAWMGTGANSNDQLANLGQLKTLFNFDLGAPPGQLPEWWQKFHFGGQTGIDPGADPDADGRTNFQEYLHGTSPNTPGIHAGPQLIDSHEPVGSLKGSFSVGSDGAASYSIPIEIPKGTAGMEPQLALSYSSNGGNGIVGLGFNVSGLQTITRGRATYRKDGFAGADGFANDRFFLNGERLVCVSGTYGANGSEYRTEIDSFARIKLTGNASSGVSSWVVETKAGLILEFGNTADSRIAPPASPAPLSWAINKVSDTKGNYYLVNYESDIPNSPPEDPNKELLNHRVKEIKYTGNATAALVPYCTVAFFYETRPDPFSSYTRGLKVKSTSRLKELRVLTGSQVNHRYELTYQTSPQSKRSILASVQRFQGTGESLPKTQIGWNVRQDTEGRRKWHASSTSAANALEWSDATYTYSKFIDLNGDGLPDRVDHRNPQTGAEGGLWVSLNTGNGFAQAIKWYTGSTAEQNKPEWYSGKSKVSGFVDMNGDGLLDRVDDRKVTGGTTVYGLWVSLNNRNGFEPSSDTPWYTSSTVSQNMIEWWDSYGYLLHSALIDLNGDGLPDKVDHHNYSNGGQRGIWVSLNTGSGFSEKERWYQGGDYYNGIQNNLQWVSGSGSLVWTGHLYSDLIDMNGDGMPDRVDHLDYDSGEYGLWVSLNTGSSFHPKEKWPADLSPVESYLVNQSTKLVCLIDINGDNLPDRLTAFHPDNPNDIGLWVALNTGSDFLPFQRWISYDDLNNASAFCGTGFSMYQGLVDLNGDGMLDRIVNKDPSSGVEGLWVALNTGDGFGSLNKWYIGSTPEQNNYRWADANNTYSDLIDMNGDGLPDRVDDRKVTSGTTDYGLWVSLNNGNGFNSSVKWYSSPTPTQNHLSWGKNGGFIDINGDGLPDRFDHRNFQSNEDGFWISLNKGNGFNEFSGVSYGPEVVSSITDGFGSEIQVEYHRLNDPSPIAGFDTRVYEKLTDSLPSSHIGVIDSRYVVSRYSEPDGMGGRRYKSQRYGDLRYDRLNEASLGFGWIEALDELTGQTTRTETRRDFPFAGSPEYTITKVKLTQADIDAMPASASPGVTLTPGMKTLSIEMATYDKLPDQPGVAGGTVYRPVQTQATRHLFDLDGTLKVGTVTTQTLTDFDAYGFVKKSTVTSLDGSQVMSNNIYTHTTSGGKWHLGRLTQSQVIKLGGGRPTINKTSSFTYDPASGLLKTETIQPGHALSTTTTYTHDDFGNITGTAVAASGETRTSTSGYDPKGRFVTSEFNSLGHTVSHGYNTQRALLESSTDINGNTTSFIYDAFGTLIRTVHPDGTDTVEVTGHAANASLPPSVSQQTTHPIAYFRATQSSGGPVAKVYLDAMGRELITEATILRDADSSNASRYSKVYAATRYDAWGRTNAVSNPFAAGETPLFTTIAYDLLGRTIMTTHPDGTFDQILAHGARILGGQPVTYSRAENRTGQVLERWEDQHGRLVQSSDPSGQTTTFQHDHEGRVRAVAIGGQTLLTNQWDIFGNRTDVWEANSGSSSATYNGFGETRTATNARGQVTTTYYDILGRPTTVEKPEGTYTTTYDGAPGAGLGQPWKTTGPAGYLERISYDRYGRVVSSSKTQFGETFTTSTGYDLLGRVATSTDAGGLTLVHGYDPLYSFPVSTHIGAGVHGAGTLLWKAGTFDAKGRPLSQTLAQGVTTGASYHPVTGLPTGQTANHSSGVLQNKSYAWSPIGNLANRSDFVAKRIETFSYDSLNRVSGATVATLAGATTTTVPPPAVYTYAANGNLTGKPGLTNVSYAGPRPHAITAATVKGQARSFTYDNAGYVTSDGRRTYTWTSFGQLASLDYVSAPALQNFAGTQIHAASRVWTDFAFDAGGNRVRQIKQRIAANDSRTIEETLYLGSYEREIHSTKANGAATPLPVKTVHRHQLGSAVYTRTVTPGSGTAIRLTTVLKDHLGSTDVLLTGTWNGSAFSSPAVERQAFDPWGERRKSEDWTGYRTLAAHPHRASGQDYDCGYTGHEQLDDSGLVHMNGRIYDPEIGRFLSPDPVVQIPEYSQDHNRYSYVLNNPLNAIDPSGFSWLSKAFGKVGKWLKENWRTIVAIAVAVVAWYASPYILGAFGASSTAGGLAATGANATWVSLGAQGAVAGGIAGGANAALHGGSGSDILRGMAVGAVQGAISGGGLHWMEGAAEASGSIWDKAAHVVGHGTVGGASNVAMGGKFQDGFLSAAAGASAGWMGAYKTFQGSGGWKVAGRTAMAGAVGGTVSVIGGGKFANGAWTASFQHLLNAEIETLREEIEEYWIEANRGAAVVLDKLNPFGDPYKSQGWYTGTEEWYGFTNGAANVANVAFIGATMGYAGASSALGGTTRSSGFWVGQNGLVALKSSGDRYIILPRFTPRFITNLTSGVYAATARGRVNVYMGKGAGKVFWEIELPHLLKNARKGLVDINYKFFKN